MGLSEGIALSSAGNSASSDLLLIAEVKGKGRILIKNVKILEKNHLFYRKELQLKVLIFLFCPISSSNLIIMSIKVCAFK